MKVVAALAVGTFCALFAGLLMGSMPQWRWRPSSARGPALWLQQSRLGMSTARFWAGSAAAGFLALLVLTAFTGSLFVALVPAAAISLAPRAYFSRRSRLRARELQDAWPDGLRDLIASIASGCSLTHAVSTMAKTGPEPIRAAFARFPELARVLGTTAALEVVKTEQADPTSDRVLEVLILANERGGSIVRTILEDLVDATTRDLKLLDALDTEGLEMRINARSVVVLPWLVLVMLTARPGPFRAFYRSGGGVATLILAAVLSAIGLAVLSRLGKEPVEERVFG